MKDNNENVHNVDIIEQISAKIGRLSDLVELVELVELKTYVYLNLLKILSHKTNEIYAFRLEFIEHIFKERATIVSYGPDILEFIILYYVLKRTKDHDILRSYIDECIEVDGNKITILCLNGRTARYIASLCYTDDDPILCKPLTDIKEVKLLRMQKVYYFFDKELKKYPVYYDAYNCKAELPNDYEEVLTDIFKKVMDDIDEHLDFDLADVLS